MEERQISSLTRELKLKQIQFNSIFEFSESIYSSFHVDSIVRIYFSTLMGQLGISRIFFFDYDNQIFEKRGFRLSEDEQKALDQDIKKIPPQWFYLTVDELSPELDELKVFLMEKKIRYLVNIAEADKKPVILGLGAKFNQKELNTENIEYAFFVSKFSRGAMENALLIDRLIESKRMEHELKIARDIQLSLLPQSLPRLKNFDISVIYKPTNEVGGDYYDILKVRHNKDLPILIADVEGKGLPAALLAASSQAIFHTLNELYLFEPGKFIAKANAMICEFTRGQRFITLVWMLVDDDKQSVTYVNAGHIQPFLITKNNVKLLSKGGFLSGFIQEAQYEKETLRMEAGDLIVAFTDGVPEVENKSDDEFGLDSMVEFLQNNRHLSAADLATALFKAITDFSQGKKFRDDFTLIILKAK
ncbi:MAG: PP2C family protein-serine/threonine phosphatase [Candidatus Aminicenantes bacterium]